MMCGLLSPVFLRFNVWGGTYGPKGTLTGQNKPTGATGKPPEPAGGNNGGYMTEKKNKLWLFAGLGGLALWVLHSRASAGATGGPAPAATPKEELKNMADWAHAILAKYGFGVVPSYVTATSATEEIVDTTGRGRVLQLKNQAATDAFHSLMWNYNGAFKFNTYDPNTAANMASDQATYATLKTIFTPEFLA